MSYTVEFTPVGIAGLEDLTPTIQEHILRKVRWLSENFSQISPQGLSADLSGLFKIRVGDYRVIYSCDEEAKIVTILDGSPR
jgi:mRNA interferase RelE/StbE